MFRQISFIFVLFALLFMSADLVAEDIKSAGSTRQINGIPQMLYPFDYDYEQQLRDGSEVTCSIRMAGDSYWAVSSWLVGDEIFKTYQVPEVVDPGCTYPFAVEAVAMELNINAAGTLWVSVDVESLDSVQSTENCPFPGNILGISDELGYEIVDPGLYLIWVPFNEPVTVNGPYFCGFYFATDVTSMNPELIVDNDPYMCVNWNNWGEGYVDLVDNPYYTFPGNLALYSIGTTGGGSSPSQAELDLIWPEDSTTQSDQVYIRLAEITDTLDYAHTQFDYYGPSTGWMTIDTDNNHAVSLRNSVATTSYQDGYSAVWDISTLPEGWYKIDTNLHLTGGDQFADTMDIYLDNTPVEPTFSTPVWNGQVCDNVMLQVDVSDENVNYVQFEYRSAPETVVFDFPALMQSRYGDTDGDTLDGNYYSSGEFGDFYNAPTVVAAMVRKFAERGYTDLIYDGGSILTDRQIVEELADSMKLRANLGAQDDNFIYSIKEYFDRKGSAFVFDMITDLDAQTIDKIIGYRQGCVMLAIGEPYGIWLGVEEFVADTNSDGSHSAALYDTKTGSTVTAEFLFEPYPQVYYNGTYRVVDLALGLYPKNDPASKTFLGSDFNPGDGLTFSWDLSGIDDGSYYVSAFCVDYSSHIGRSMTRARVTCFGDYIAGDTNDDGTLNISDVVWLMNYVFREGPEPMPFLMNGDNNCDATVDVSDATYMINYIFTYGPPPCER